MKNRCFLGQLPALVLCEIKEKGFVSPNAAEPRHGAFVVILSPHLREWDLLTMPDAAGGLWRLLTLLNSTWELRLSRGAYCLISQGPGTLVLSV